MTGFNGLHHAQVIPGQREREKERERGRERERERERENGAFRCAAFVENGTACIALIKRRKAQPFLLASTTTTILSEL